MSLTVKALRVGRTVYIVFNHTPFQKTLFTNQSQKAYNTLSLVIALQH